MVHEAKLDGLSLRSLNKSAGPLLRCILLGTSFGQRKSEIAYFDVLTFWPSFAIFKNDLGNWAKVKDIVTLRPATSTEFRGGSCCGSQIGWGPHICKVLPGCIIAHSKTPVNLHTAGLAGTSVDVLGWGWGGDRGWMWWEWVGSECF